MTKPIRKILVPTDGSLGAAKAARWAATLAKSVDGTLVLVHISPLVSAAVMGMRALDEAGFEEMRRALSDDALRQTREVLPDDVPVEQLQAFGDPAKEIVHLASKLEVDLIVMGSRGLSAFKELILGSVCDKVMRHAGVPVTVVR